MHRVFIGIMFMFAVALAAAQNLKSFSPVLEHHLSRFEEGERFRIFVEADPLLLEQAAQESQLEILGGIAGFQLIDIDIEGLRTLLDVGALSFVESPMGELRPLADVMLENNNVLAVHQGLFPINTSLTGDGIIIGMVDSGIELEHPDFQYEDGTTRIIELWDHTSDGPDSPLPYDFGNRCTRSQIDAGECGAQEQAIWFGHGSTVTGVACSDGSAVDDYTGVAPGSEMVVVSFDFSRPGFLADVVNSIQYIFDVAETEGRPCVINTSLGTYYGSHDGLDPASLYIDSLLAASPGRAVVAAVGNTHTLDPYHLRMQSNEGDTVFTWLESEAVLSIGGGGVLYEFWADIESVENASFATLVDDSNPLVGTGAAGEYHSIEELLGQSMTEVLTNTEGDTLAQVEYWAQYRGDQVQVQVYIPEPESMDHLYRLSMAGEGLIDMWSTNTFGTSDIVQGDDLPDHPEISAYQHPDRRMHMVSSWTCSDQVITVANRVNRSSYFDVDGQLVTIDEVEGDLAKSSSSGPTRDGRPKPDLAATGTTTLSTAMFSELEALLKLARFKVAPGGMHFRNGGSSMASPVVAGTAALILEQCPHADHSLLKQAILESVVTDDFTGLELPDERWGSGKLDAYGAVSSLAIEVELTMVGDSLFATGGETYEWYLDDELIEDENGDLLSNLDMGVYEVVAIAENGCRARSMPLDLTSLQESDRPEWLISPNPGNGQIQIRGLQARDEIRIYDSMGRLCELLPRRQSDPLDISSLASGVYHIELTRGSRRAIQRYVLH